MPEGNPCPSVDPQTFIVWTTVAQTPRHAERMFSQFFRGRLVTKVYESGEAAHQSTLVIWYFLL